MLRDTAAGSVTASEAEGCRRSRRRPFRWRGTPDPAKGLTGPGYDGHTFWDTEAFVLPMLTYTIPPAAREVLRWRHPTLDRARQRAHELGQAGAMFPWRSINGDNARDTGPPGPRPLRGDAFTPDQKQRNFDYYEPLTVRDSSLSACCQAVIAAEVGYLDLAYDYPSRRCLSTCTIFTATSPADCISLHWRVRGLIASPDSVACVITAAKSLSRHGCPANCPTCRSGWWCGTARSSSPRP
jgi:hypothetical protein